MARVNNLSNFLTDVASAIKTKKGSETAIPAANFDTEIRNLPSQGTYQTKNVTISSNTVTNITPDNGYDALERVNVTTTIPEKQLQTKSRTISDNGSIVLTPDTGYDGFDKVNLTVQVSGGNVSEVEDIRSFNSMTELNSFSSFDMGDIAVLRNSPLVPLCPYTYNNYPNGNYTLPRSNYGRI